VRAAVLAHPLLAPLAAEHLLAQLAAGISRDEVVAGLVELVVGA
jgi:hypothetical protein